MTKVEFQMAAADKDFFPEQTLLPLPHLFEELSDFPGLLSDKLSCFAFLHLPVISLSS